MAFAGPWQDQLAIRALNESYADAVFRRDAQAWGICWTDDATWHLMGNTITGRAAIVAAWETAMAGFKFVAFFVQPGSLQVDGDSASGTVYTHEVLENQAGVLLRPVGRYDDRYSRLNGIWLFAERRYTMLKG